MNVSPAASSSFVSNQLEKKHHVQDVFSEVLAQFGHQGYESARSLEGNEPLAENIQTAWSDWFDSISTERYSQQSVEQREQLKKDYGEILFDAYAEGAYYDPKAFLKNLLREELSTVQGVHHLANPIAVDSLTEEGALNLLLPQAAQVDLNHDGLTRSGLAYGMRFPDSNTPADVTAAWEKATAGLSFQDKMMYELHMMLPILTANIHVDENGAFSHVTEPGDPDFVNPMADPNYSYYDAVQGQLDALDFAFSKGTLAREDYDRHTAFWENFQALLDDSSQE